MLASLHALTLGVALAAIAPLALVGCGGDTTSGGGGSGAGTGSDGDAEPKDMVGMTAAHNAVRASVDPPADPAIPPLAWSGEVAAVAQAYAENCMFAHSGGQYGENIYAGTAQATPDAVVTSWASEVSNYTYASNSCSDVCGHYTQVVWRDSAKLGCGVANCSENSPFGGGDWQLWVCNYDPPGNFVGQPPY
jgi:hypothetical protein